ncbi:MAG: hypothetical protein UW30_C0003G0013 [Candidatus Giovannonibacteria bacterium GW2011_GWA2_44_13b]|uniref:Uncharacterized protein n=2 Tax=Candidatus Giovannoniibacteriota TaxID=1752738 RepID=A0A0G1H5X0_9BACT|nr:MAG: hypothetical protein UW30_C0003G0013 [Candidatus Giovannonibacteria bacterium GW2011_GWA2_44_13b]OGF81484.1 MAG: hypothetical protein A2924_00040 [Candidatus Giovannonibacteria bacterium RIFCSPLOWO2_01_FULL_44_16]
MKKYSFLYPWFVLFPFPAVADCNGCFERPLIYFGLFFGISLLLLIGGFFWRKRNLWLGKALIGIGAIGLAVCLLVIVWVVVNLSGLFNSF